MGPNHSRLHLRRVLNQAAELVELISLLDRFWNNILDQKKLAFPHFILGRIFLLLLVALGDLCVLFFDAVDFGKIDEGDVLLSVDLLQLETLVDRVAAHQVDLLLDQWQLHLLLPPILPHYYFISD